MNERRNEWKKVNTYNNKKKSQKSQLAGDSGIWHAQNISVYFNVKPDKRVRLHGKQLYKTERLWMWHKDEGLTEYVSPG